MTVDVRDTSAQGDLTEVEVTLALMRDGRRVFRPLSSASRYDLLLDNGDGTFTRVQCKTGVLRRGAVVFRLYSVSGHRSTAASTPRNSS
jgi:PD-(D/E)XK nuclease superfamily protein